MTLLLKTAAIDELRNNEYRLGKRTLLLERADNNLCPKSEDLSAWTKGGGTGTATGGQADPAGGATAYKLDDQDAAVDVNWSSPNFGAYTGTYTTRGYSFFYKADTAAACNVGIYDATAAVYRAQFTSTPVAGILTAAGVTLSGGAGRVVAVLPSTTEPGHYRVLVEADNIVVANTHKFIVRPAGVGVANVGASIVWGFHAHQISTTAHSYFPNAGASGGTTSGSDILRLPWLTPPGALTVYNRHYEIGAQRRAVVEVATMRLWQLSDINNVDPRLLLSFNGSVDLNIQHANAATGAIVSTGVTTPTLVYGDLVESIGWLYQDGSVQCGFAINGAAAVYSVRSAAKTLPAAWAADGTLASQKLMPAGTINGCAELEALAALPGIFTFDECRALRR